MKSAVNSFTGRHMFMIMAAFFTTVVAANMTMVYFASHSWTGLVVKNSYVASQQFNATTAALEKAEAGAHVKIDYENGKLAVRFTGEDGAALEATDVVMSIGRPSHEGEDRDIPLQRAATGEYSTSMALAAGQWSGTLTAHIPGHSDWKRPVYLVVGNTP